MFSGNGSSNWDVSFKLADLSLCHFKQSESLLHDDSDLDAFGTRAYGESITILCSAYTRLINYVGAPETFRPNDTKDSFPIQVRPEVDIWSTGCVFSEAAVWSRFGWNRVLEYRNRRQGEIKRTFNFDGEHLFHDGSKVLRTVQEVHRDIAVSSRDIDHVVVEALRLLDEDMLLKENQTRSSAKEVYFKSRAVIERIREEFHIPTTTIPRRIDDKGYLSDSEESPKTPPCVPPGYFSRNGAFSRSQVATFPPARPMSINSAISCSSSLHGVKSPRQYHSIAYVNRHQSHQDEKGLAASPSDSHGFHDLPDPPSPTTSHHSSNLDKFKALSIETRGLDHRPRYRRKHHESIGETSIRTANIAPNKVSLRRNQSEKKPSTVYHRGSLESVTDSTNGPPSPVQDAAQPVVSSPLLLNGHHSEPTLVNLPRPKDHELRKQLKAPHLSLEEGFSWKSQRKMGLSTPLPGSENLVYLNERDHVGICLQ